VTGYYAERLSGRRLRQCYELAPPRVRQYLEAEIRHVLSRLRRSDTVLELGCGYGRVAVRLAAVARRVVGIDTADESLELARALTDPDVPCEYVSMDATAMAFAAGTFDATVCVQNGICAFGVDQEALVCEALRVTRPGGVLLFSTYADRFWPHRLAWFQAQAAAGLVGRIDEPASGDGVIVCEDGFRAGRLTPDDWRRLCSRIGLSPRIVEVDESSVFCELTKRTPTADSRQPIADSR